MDTELKGIRRRKVNHVFYFVIDLSQLTLESILGGKACVTEDARQPQESWRWSDLAAWFLDQAGTSATAFEIDAIRDLVLREPLNQDPLLQNALAQDPVPSFLDQGTPGSMDVRRPTIFMFREDEFPIAAFRGWFGRRMIFGYGDAATRSLRQEIEAFRARRVTPLQHANDNLEESLIKPLQGVLAKLQAGELVYTAMFDFLKPASERAAMWRLAGGGYDDRSVWNFVDPRPDEGRQRRVASERGDWSHILTATFHELLLWANRESVGACHRDQLAEHLLTELRSSSSPIVRALQNPDLLMGADEVALRALINDAIRNLVRSPRALDQLMASEFALLAIAASEDAVSLPAAKSAEEEALKFATETFAPRQVFRAKETPLAVALAQLYKNAKLLPERLPVVLDVLAVAAPFLNRKLLQEDATGRISSAFFWRTVIGTLQPSSDTVKGMFWDHFWAMSRGKYPRGVDGKPLRILDPKSGSLALKLHEVTSSPAWRALNVLVPILLYAGTLYQNKDSPQTKILRALQAVTATFREGLAVAEVLHLSPRMMQLLAQDSEIYGALVKDVTERTPIKALGPVVEALGFAIAVDTYMTSRTKQSEAEKEKQLHTVLLGACSLALAVAQLAFPLTIASLVLLVGSQIILNRDIWPLFLPGVEAATAPQKFLAGLLREVDDSEIMNQLRKSPTSQVERADRDLRRLLRDLETAIRPDTRRHWEIGGNIASKALPIQEAAVGVLQQHYGFHADAAARLAQYSKEDT